MSPLPCILDEQGVAGQWSELNGQYCFRAHGKAVLNWWPSTGTLNVQGPQAVADQLRQRVLIGLDALPDAGRKTQKRIFVVHGHDTHALDQLELLLRRLGLDPFILKNENSKSRTIIEALEQQVYNHSAFGIVLMTPDDYGYSNLEKDADKQPRARQKSWSAAIMSW